MSHLAFGLLSGTLFGLLSVGLMLPLAFPDKRAALLAAFLNRFGIGLVIAVSTLAWPGWAVGVFFGLLLSLPAAIITKAWAPIIGIGTLGGALIGAILPHVTG